MFDAPLSDADRDALCSGISLHKFYSFSETTIEALSAPYLWFSHIDAFNDPFEGQFQYVFHPSIDQIIHYEMADEAQELKLRQEYEIDPEGLIERLRPYYIQQYENAARKDRYAYCCLFSEHTESSSIHVRALARMWSLYGNGLRGLRVNYDASTLMQSLGLVRAEPIQYVESPVAPDILGYLEAERVGHGPRWTHSTYLENAQNKHVDWAYESEFRIRSKTSGPMSYSIDAIKSVDIGERMPAAQQRVIRHILLAQNPSITFNQARVKKHSFNIEITPEQ
jgi:hypothetical protein